MVKCLKNIKIIVIGFLNLNNQINLSELSFQKFNNLILVFHLKKLLENNYAKKIRDHFFVFKQKFLDSKKNLKLLKFI